jgi:hypothetical protein
MAPTPRKRLPTSTTRRSLTRLSLQSQHKRNTNVNNVSTTNKKARDLMLKPLIELLYNKKTATTPHKLPHNEISNMFNSYKPFYPWLTKHMLKGRLIRMYNKLHPTNLPIDTPNTTETATSTVTDMQSNTTNKSTSTTPDSVSTNPITTINKESPSPSTNLVNKKQAGRPVGTTSENTQLIRQCIISAEAEITYLYKQEVDKCNALGNNRVRVGTYKRIHDNIKKIRNLPSHFCFPYNTAKKRLQRLTQTNELGVPVGHHSPLRGCEDDIIDIIIKLGKIGCPLTCGQTIQLINELIDNTVHQERLVEWKKSRKIQQPADKLKKIGKSYWYAFLQRHEDRISTKRGRKFELDQTNWTKYRHFLHMYEDVETEMIAVGLAIKFDTPVWLDEKGCQVEETKACGMKVSTQLLCPDMCIVMDEVGCNINMTKDGHVNGNRFVVAKNDKAKQRASKKEKHFTCLGLSLLTGQPLMCVVIIDGKTDHLLIRTGVDIECESYNPHLAKGEDKYDYLLNNMGPGHQYPGGPSCSYEGKTIPCMVAFNVGGGISATILTDIFRTMDKLEFFLARMELGRLYCLMGIPQDLIWNSLTILMTIHTNGQCILESHMGHPYCVEILYWEGILLSVTL